MNDEFEFRSYQSGDEVKIFELFKQCYGQDLDENVWKWRFQNNPAGLGDIELVWSGNILVGHYAITTMRTQIGGQEYLTGLSGTTMTHPSYRGLGLFPLLARRAYKRMVENGKAMVWGFPNAMSHRGFIKNLRWRDIYEIPTLRLLISERLRLPNPANNVTVCKKFDDRFDQMWDQAKSRYGVGTIRDSMYLQWRYMNNPAECYRTLIYTDHDAIMAYVVFKRYRDELQIVDLFGVDDPEPLLHLVAQVAEIAREESARAISLWLNVMDPLHHQLEKSRFVLGEPVTYFGGLALLPALLSSSSLVDFRDWYITMGDSDVF